MCFKKRTHQPSSLVIVLSDLVNNLSAVSVRVVYKLLSSVNNICEGQKRLETLLSFRTCLLYYIYMGVLNAIQSHCCIQGVYFIGNYKMHTFMPLSEPMLIISQKNQDYKSILGKVHNLHQLQTFFWHFMSHKGD